MTAFTLAELRSQTRFRGDYQNVRKFSDSDVNLLLQKGFQAFWQLVADAHQGYWDTSANVATTAATAFVALPSDAWRVQGVDIYDGDVTTELFQAGISDRNKFGATSAKPVAYRLTARGIDLLPTPDAAYTLRVIYTPFAPALAESQPRQWYNGWESYVVEWALLELDKRNGRPIGDRLKALELAENLVRSGVVERRSQEPEYLRLREFDTIDPFGEEIF